MGERVQFGRFHTRTPEREREGEGQLRCVCASKENVFRSELIGPIYRQFT